VILRKKDSDRIAVLSTREGHPADLFAPEQAYIEWGNPSRSRRERGAARVIRSLASP
jgi:hypothetical protein